MNALLFKSNVFVRKMRFNYNLFYIVSKLLFNFVKPRYSIFKHNKLVSWLRILLSNYLTTLCCWTLNVYDVHVCFQSYNKDDDMGRPSQDPGGAVGGGQRAASEHRRAVDAGRRAAEYPQHTLTRCISIDFAKSY